MALVLATLAQGSAALAQAAASQPNLGQLEDIIVTGTKRAENMQSLPIAVSAVTAQQINSTFRTDVRALNEIAPNVVIENVTGFNAAAPGIRGTGTNAILVTQDSAVGFLIDEFALSHVQSQLLSVFDLEQIEVYRGPQGTLFGKNTTGGVVAIRTKRPDLEEMTGEIQAKYGVYGRGKGRETKTLRVAVNVPIIENKLGVRLSGIIDQADGYYTNNKVTSPGYLGSTFAGLFTGGVPVPGIVDVRTGAPISGRAVGDGRHLGGKQVFAGRAKVLWKPTENFEVYGIYENVRDRSDSPPGVNESPSNAEIASCQDPLCQIDPRRATGLFVFNLLGFPGIHTTGQDSDNEIFETGQTNGTGSAVDVLGGHDVDVDGYYLNLTYSADSWSLKSITGVRNQTETLASTYTGEAFRSLFDASRNLERQQIQQEIRFVSDFQGPLNFIAGVAYYEDNVDFRSYATVGLSGLFATGTPVTITDPLNPAFGGRIGSAPPFQDANGNLLIDGAYINDPTSGFTKQDRHGWAIYADGSYDITDQLKFSAGIRWTYDKKNFTRGANGGGLCDAQGPGTTDPLDRRNVGGVCLDARSNAVSRAGLAAEDVDPRNLPFGLEAFGTQVVDSASWSEITWRAALSYKFESGMLAYANVATGFQSGGFTETCSSVATCKPFSPEKNTNFELGLKSDLFDNTLRLNLAAFYTKYTGLQRNQVIPFTDAFGVTTQETITINAGASRALGFEVEATWLPIDNLRLGANIGFLDHKYTDFAIFLQTTDTAPTDLSSLRVPFSNKWNIGLNGDYEIPVGDKGAIQLGASMHYRSSGAFSPFNSLYTDLQPRTLVGANISWKQADDRWRVTLYGTNLLNEVYRVSANSVAGLWNFTQYGDPRELGVEVAFKF